MREFDYSKLKDRTWNNEILMKVANIHEAKGRQELYLVQKPEELNRLVEIAKIQSTEASNAIEGIKTKKDGTEYVSNPFLFKEIMKSKE